MSQTPRSFPDSFLFGAATASYQIEGAVAEDGRLPSIWDTFSHTPGRTFEGDTGDVADDHYHRMADDVAAMAEIGLTAYRFSIAWPRIQPTGSGQFNQAGFDFYHRLFDELAKARIKPLVTLYHWDLPQALEDAGGWPVRETAYAFAAYARRVIEEFKDRDAVWTTFNEPWCTAFLGYSSGAHAPGRSEPGASLAAMHHLNLAHGLAHAEIHAVKPDATVALVLNSHMPRPWNVADERDVKAALLIDGLANRVFMDPFLHGSYPADVVEATQSLTDWSFVRDGDYAIMAGTIDLLGVNYYSSHSVRHNDKPHAETGEDGHKKTLYSCWPGADHVQFMPLIGTRTTMGWNVDPSAFHAHLMRMHRDTRLPMIVTENGASWPDVVDADGRIRDRDRSDYLHDHMNAVLDAIDEGANVGGYCAWSLMDNFEWGYGFSKRFGMLRVDYDTRVRTWKDSAYWYQETIKNRSLTPRERAGELAPTPPKEF